MVIELDCGSVVQVLRMDRGYQLVEVLEEPQDLRKGRVRPVGKMHRTIAGALDEVLHFALNEFEALTWLETQEVIQSTLDKVQERLLDVNSEHLV
ncbi:ABC transporter ATP-binding protein [Testudinibacter sp. P27/CKL/0425]